MKLSAADFVGFNAGAGDRYLKSFDAQTRQRGEKYFKSGAVKSLECIVSGCDYTAAVLGGELYRVTLTFDDDSGGWMGDCTCPMEMECKHVYAAFKKLLTEYASALVDSLSAGDGKNFVVPDPVVPSEKRAAFADVIRQKLGRKLNAKEAGFLQNVSRLFQSARNGGLYYVNELSVLGVNHKFAMWNRLELYPSVPKTEAEFWNYLALYFAEKLKQPIPEFLEPVTDLTVVRDRMRRLQRGKEIERWTQTLSRLGDPSQAMAAMSPAAGPVELRLRFTPQQ